MCDCGWRLQELLDSDEYDRWRGDRLGNSLFIHEPERASRIYDYAETGSDGSKHCEVIEDWRQCLSDCFDELSEFALHVINAEIDKCEQWHIDNGSYEQIIG